MALMYDMETVNKAMTEAAKLYASCKSIRARRVLDIFAGMKPVEVEPVVHARWVYDDFGHTCCSNCRERLPYIHCYNEEPCSDYDEEWDEEMPESSYCPQCGAKMDGEVEE